MKVLWVCNVPIPNASLAFDKRIVPYGGWLIQVYNRLLSNNSIQITYAFPDKISNVERKDNFIRFPELTGRGNITENEIESMYQVIQETAPDVLHIFGTEMRHSLAVAYAFSKPKSTIVNIQGVISEIASRYCTGIPVIEQIIPTLAEVLLRTGNLKAQQRAMAERGELEIELLQYVKTVIGRTKFDHDFSLKVNPDINYLNCNETLRDEYYLGKLWNYNKSEKHSIFISQASYPIKGFHYFLKALVMIKRKYPDVKVYVAGDRLDAETLKNKILKSSYQRYIRRLLLRHGLNKNVVFLGRLSSKEMLERYINANVSVLCSSTENSPNSLGEAMILGVPVIASNVGGVPDMLSSADEEMYVFDDSYELARKINCIFEKKDKTMLDRDNRIVKAKRLFDLNQNTKNFLDAYNTVFNKHM